MSRAKFMQIAAQAGIEVDYSAGRKHHPRTGEPVEYELMLDHPLKVFEGSGCHCNGSLMGSPGEVTPDWRKLVQELQAVIAEGFSDCDDDECDICHSED